MSQKARVGDTFTGTCCQHKHCRGVTGIIIQSSYVTISDYMGAARIFDLVQADCGHIGIIVSGASVVNVDFIPVAYVGSMVSCGVEGVVIAGSPTVNVQ